LCNEAIGQWRERTTLGQWERGRRPDGHNGVFSVTGSAISPASVHALTLDSTQTVTWSRQREGALDRPLPREYAYYQTVNDGVAHSKNPRKCAYHVTFDLDLEHKQAYLETIVCKFGHDPAICLEEEAIFVPAQKCSYHVTFDLDLEHTLDAR